MQLTPGFSAVSYTQLRSGNYTIVLQSQDFSLLPSESSGSPLAARVWSLSTASQTPFAWASIPDTSVLWYRSPQPNMSASRVPRRRSVRHSCVSKKGGFSTATVHSRANQTTLAVTNVILETNTIIATPETVVSECDVPTQTVVDYRDGPTTTIWTTIERMRTNGALTSYYQTTMVLGAYCHWPAPSRRSIVRRRGRRRRRSVTAAGRGGLAEVGHGLTRPARMRATRTRLPRAHGALRPSSPSVTILPAPPSSTSIPCLGDRCSITRPRGPTSSPVITSIT